MQFVLSLICYTENRIVVLSTDQPKGPNSGLKVFGIFFS